MPGGPKTSAVDELAIRPDFPVTPVDIELEELNGTQGGRAIIKRADEIERNRFRREKRKQARDAYERYSVLAYNRNIQLSAEKIVAEKLAAERAAAKKPPAPAGPDQSRATTSEVKATA